MYVPRLTWSMGHRMPKVENEGVKCLRGWKIKGVRHWGVELGQRDEEENRSWGCKTLKVRKREGVRLKVERVEWKYGSS